jgi:yeast amino acid transporter
MEKYPSTSVPSEGEQSTPTTLSSEVPILRLTTSDVQAKGERLKRNIDKRQLIFMALGGSIGAGLFVGSGGALNIGGPASLVLNFAIVGLMVTFTMGALGELASRSSRLPHLRG